MNSRPNLNNMLSQGISLINYTIEKIEWWHARGKRGGRERESEAERIMDAIEVWR